MNKEGQIQLLEKYLKQELDYTEYFDNWAIHYLEDFSFLYKLYLWLSENNSFTIEDVDSKIVYEKTENMIQIKNSEKSFLTNLHTLKNIIKTTIDILTPLLPTGTVVDLKKEAFKRQFSTDNIENMRFIIIQQFAISQNIPFYFPYGGIVHPLGFSGTKNILYFTPDLIDKVVFEGFSDEAEGAFETQIKTEMIIHHNYHSIFLQVILKSKNLHNRLYKEKLMSTSSNEINLDVELAIIELEKLATAIADFRPFTETFIKDAEEMIDTKYGNSSMKQNSDFITELREAIKTIKDDTSAKTLIKVEQYHENFLNIVNEFNALDIRMAERTGNNG